MGGRQQIRKQGIREWEIIWERWLVVLSRILLVVVCYYIESLLTFRHMCRSTFIEALSFEYKWKHALA